MLGTGADRLCTPSTATGPFRLFGVPGFNNRANDVVYCPPIVQDSSQQEPTAVVYFGGDVQDFPESMETNRDSRGYMKYNLENSAILLREAFPHSHIIVIRPVRMEFKTFSCFDNFVRGNNAGVPDHTPMNHALQHLERLLQNLSQRLINLPESEIEEQAAQSAATAAAVASATALSLSASTVDSNNLSTVNKITSMHAAASSSSVPTTITHVSNRQRITKSANHDNHQEMEIDIMQVHENSPSLQITNSNDQSNGKDDSPIDATKSSITLNNGTKIDHNDADGNIQEDECSSTNSNDLDNTDVNMPNDRSSPEPEHITNPLWWREHLNLDKAKLHLIGFSKGCVVLNQFIYEFHYLKTLTPDDSTMGRLLSRIKEMYWLDGGHGGQKNTWITSRSLLETLTRMGINAHVHLTPYQVQDERRPWIRKEEKLFSDMLKKLGCTVIRQLHYENQTPNLMTHFEVLNAFCQFQNQMLHQIQINQQNEQNQQQLIAQQQQHQHQHPQSHHQQQQHFQNENGNEKTQEDTNTIEEK